jgi:uncharacterized protein (DUF1015 family)
MALIRPFRAWRYNEEKISDINLKFSPLFDVVTPEQLQALYAIPNNSVHIATPRSQEEAIGKLAEWKQHRILRQDDLPAIYIYYQQFSLFGDTRQYTRKGFVCMIRVDQRSGQHGSDIVLHEDTISASVAERTQLLAKTLLNTAPTHGLYDDPDFALEPLMDSYMEEPLYEYIDYQGVVNQLAVVNDKRDIDRFMAHMAQRQVYLADGHHRLASSVLLQKQLSERPEGLDPMSMANYHLMYLTNLRSDDLRILPIHRTVRLEAAPASAEEFLAPFAARFEVLETTRTKRALIEELRTQPRSYGLVIGSRQFLLTLRDSVDAVADNPLPLPEAVKQLEYTQLHYFVFDQLLGIPYQQQHGSDRIRYLKDAATAVRTAMDNPLQVAFLTRDLSMHDMMSVCASGALMPQKSTFFYPKVLCGLVFASIDDHENNSTFDSCFR